MKAQHIFVTYVHICVTSEQILSDNWLKGDGTDEVYAISCIYTMHATLCTA